MFDSVTWFDLTYLILFDVVVVVVVVVVVEVVEDSEYYCFLLYYCCSYGLSLLVFNHVQFNKLVIKNDSKNWR